MRNIRSILELIYWEQLPTIFEYLTLDYIVDFFWKLKWQTKFKRPYVPSARYAIFAEMSLQQIRLKKFLCINFVCVLKSTTNLSIACSIVYFSVKCPFGQITVRWNVRLSSVLPRFWLHVHNVILVHHPIPLTMWYEQMGYVIRWSSRSAHVREANLSGARLILLSEA